LIYNKVLASKLFSFGFWVLLESFGAWLIVWGDNLIVGRFLGIHDLGVYRTGWMLVTILFGLALNPFLPVLYPTFSRLQDDLPALKNTFHRVNRVVVALALPMGIGLWLTGPELATIFFGSKWQGLGLVLSILGLTYGLAWSVGINTELYRAMGRPDINTKLMLVTVLLYMPAYYIAAQFSLEIFLYVRLSLVFVGIAIQVYLCRRTLNVSPFYLWHNGKNFVLAAMAMALVIAALKWGILPMIHVPHVSISLAIFIGTGSLIYLGCLWFLDRAFMLGTINLIKKTAFA
jgi:O-antigen/teichoic acid export membrane protein